MKHHVLSANPFLIILNTLKLIALKHTEKEEKKKKGCAQERRALLLVQGFSQKSSISKKE